MGKSLQRSSSCQNALGGEGKRQQYRLFPLSHLKAFVDPDGGLQAIVGENQVFVLGGEDPTSDVGVQNFSGALRLTPWHPTVPSIRPPSIFVARTLEVSERDPMGLGFAVAEVGEGTFGMALGLEGFYPMRPWSEGSPHVLGAALAYLQTEGYLEASASDGGEPDLRNAKTIKIPRPGFHAADVVKIIPQCLNSPTRVFLRKGLTEEFVELVPGRDFVEYFDGDGGNALGLDCIKINPWRDLQNPVLLGEFRKGWDGYHALAPIWPDIDNYTKIGDARWKRHI